MTNKKKFKIPPKRIDSSECVVHVGQHIQNGKVINEGEGYKVHEGEYIEIIPIITMGESIALLNVANLTDDSKNADKSFEAICVSLSNKIVDWNWTDMTGELLDKPYKNPEVFKNLNTEELMYLVTVSTGETPSEQKNESNDSLNTPLAEVQNNLPSR